MARNKIIFLFIVGTTTVILAAIIFALLLRGWLVINGPASVDGADRATLNPPVDSDLAVTKEGLQIEVISVKYDGWPWIEVHNQFNDPPLAGKHMLLMHLRITNVSREQSVFLSTDESDFQVVGERRELYATYGEDTSCGVVPDALDGVMLPGESMTGNVCVQVPLDEDGFQLVYKSYISDELPLVIDLPPAERRLGR
jgi:hypothetical protein